MSSIPFYSWSSEMEDNNIPRPPPAVTGTAKTRKESLFAPFSVKVGKVRIVQKTTEKNVNKAVSLSASAAPFPLFHL